MSESGDSVESETVTERTDVGEQAQAGPHLDVSLPIRENEITALIGPSGCGKTTVLRCLNRMNDLIEGARVEGTILYHGIDLYDARVDPVEVRRRVGMVFQKPNPFPKSIYDNVSFGPKIAGYRGSMDDLVEESLTRAALWDEVKDKLKESGMALSGGQQQRLCIARAIDRTAFFTVDVREDGQRTGTLVEFDRTEVMFTNPSEKRTEDYVTGRFG